MRTFRLAILPVVLAATTAGRADAAASFDGCAGFIDTLPTTLSTQGVWCLRKDIATSMTAGNAITVAVNNVTIDCNGFKIGGLAAGTATETFGVYALERLNFTIRDCTMRGFQAAVVIDGEGGGGHLVEDNRFDGNTAWAMIVSGDGTLIRRNRVLDTGGSTHPGFLQRSGGIFAYGDVDVIDNVVRVVDQSGRVETDVFGIRALGAGAGTLQGNRISGLIPGSEIGRVDIGIELAQSQGVVIRGNDITGAYIGLRCSDNNLARDNSILFSVVVNDDCVDGGGNLEPF